MDQQGLAPAKDDRKNPQILELGEDDRVNTRVLEPGEKVHIIFRRRFEGDPRRHFAGTILAVAGPVGRVSGYAFVYNQGSSEWEKRPDKRTRIIPLGDADLIVIIMPAEVDVDSIHYAVVDRHLVVTDGTYTLDINEFGTMA